VSAWKELEEALQAQPVRVKLTQREAFVVQEALGNWANRVLDEASAWDVLENFRLLAEWWPFSKKSTEKTHPIANMTGGGQKAVKGLDPREVQLVRTFASNAKSKSGETGEIMALPPKEWQRIKQEIESQPDYYDQMLGNVISASGLVKKIEDQLRGEMGGAATAKKEPIDPGPGMDGKPDDVTPAIHGSDQFNVDPTGVPAGSPAKKPPRKRAPTPTAPPAGAPSAGDPVSRRKRVAAQDAQMMGGKTKPIGRVKVR
jgi:hypothetical protein